MRINNVTLLLNFLALLLTIITTKVFATEVRSRVILVYPDNVHPFHKLENKDAAAISFLMHAENKIWAAANLTKLEINDLNSVISVAHGTITENNVIFKIQDINETTAQPTLTVSNKYLTNTPHCNITLDGVDFVIVDTVAFGKNISSEFSTTNITYGPIFTTNRLPCNTHASEVISTIVGTTTGVIPHGDRSIYNIGVFDCNGQAFPEQIIQGFNAALQFAKVNAKNGRRTIVNFSGVGAKNIAINLAATALADAGIAFFAAAGNSGINACESQSPASATGVFVSGATTPPGDKPAQFTNFGSVCVSMFLPGEGVTVVDIINGGTKLASGTSFTSPVAASLGALEDYYSKTTSVAQMFERISSPPRTRLVNPPLGSNFFYPMNVMLSANACPDVTRLFNAIKTNKHDNGKFGTWYNAARNGAFCVSFRAKAKSGAIFIGLRSDAADLDVVQVIIGDNKQVQRGGHANVISKNGINLNQTNLNSKILQSKLPIIFSIMYGQSTLYVKKDTPFGDDISLLSAALHKLPQQIAFSSVDGSVTYGSGMKCIL